MALKEILNKLKQSGEEESENASRFSKFITIIAIGIISFIPMYFIWNNIQKAMGDQPKIAAVMTGVIVSIALLLIFLVWKTRPKNK